jgi:cytochrome c553
MRNTFLLDVGPKMLKSVLTLDQAVGGLNNRLQDLIRFMQISAIPVIGLLVIKFGLLVKAHAAMSGIIGAITIASVVINKVMAAQQQEIEENTKKWTRYGIEAGKALATTTRELEQLLASTQAQIDSTFTALKGEIEDSMEESGKDVSKFAGLLEEEFRNSTEHAKNKIKDLQAEIESLGRIQENINSAITGMRLRTEDQMFRFLLDDAGIEQQADLWLNQIKKIEEELQQAFNLGDHVDLQRLTGELDKALLAYRKLQKDIIAENKKTHEMRVDLINKEEELRGRAKITKDRGERSGIMAQADELRRQLESLRLIEVPNLNIPDRYLRSMQDVESKLRDLRNQARKEEEKAIVRLAKEERRQNEMTAIQKQLQDLNLLEIITKELTGDLRKRELHIQEVKRIAGTVEDRADRLRELSKEGGFDTEVMEKLARQQSETLIAHLASIEEHHRATTAQERATEFVENMSDNIAGLAEEIEKHKQVMDKIGLFTIDLERSLETDRKVIQALGMGGMLMSGDTSEVSRVARSEPVLERMKEELERRAAVVQFLQNELESRQRLMNQAEEWAKGETVARDKVTKSFNAINSEGAVLIIRFQRLQKMFQNLESQGRAALSGPNVTGNRKFGGASYGSEGRYLTPGEFVMSGGATRRMFNQLLTTNSATSAASGSSVNVGDINITMQTHGNVNYDGRRLVNQIRREIRQGSLAV